MVKKSILVGIYNAGRKGRAAIIYNVDGLSHTVDRDWKKTLKQSLEKEGWIVVSISVAKDAERFDVVATCHRRGEAPLSQNKAASKGKPVSRGGVAIDGPVKTGRTMAGKARALRGVD